MVSGRYDRELGAPGGRLRGYCSHVQRGGRAAEDEEWGRRPEGVRLSCMSSLLGSHKSDTYSLQDHFLLVGPSLTVNPAALQEQDDVLEMFSKIVVTGNAHVTVSCMPGFMPAYQHTD